MTNSPTPNVIFLALSGIGNYIMQSPTIAHFRRHALNAHITVWVAPRGTRALAEEDPNVNQVIEHPIKSSLREHLVTAWRLRQTSYNIGFVLHPGQHSKSAGFLWLAGTPRRIGVTYPLRGKRDSTFLLTDTVLPLPHLHDIEQNMQLLTLINIPVPTKHTSYI
ncbi:MAG: glycosyltransferase family 9 protein, partial [Acidobacteriota bacterium]